ncbi:MAG: hypothetical protein ACYC1T_09620 [Sulfuricaulis sp.]
MDGNLPPGLALILIVLLGSGIVLLYGTFLVLHKTTISSFAFKLSLATSSVLALITILSFIRSSTVIGPLPGIVAALLFIWSVPVCIILGMKSGAWKSQHSIRTKIRLWSLTLIVCVTGSALPLIIFLSIPPETLRAFRFPKPDELYFYGFYLGAGLVIFVIMAFPMIFGLRLWLYVLLKAQSYEELLEELLRELGEKAPIIRIIKEYGGYEK